MLGFTDQRATRRFSSSFWLRKAIKKVIDVWDKIVVKLRHNSCRFLVVLLKERMLDIESSQDAS